MADWDDEDFEPGEITGESKTDKWEGEDEDEDVKDNWDDDDESNKKPEEEKQTEVASQKKKKRSLKEVLQEKEEKKREEAEKRAEQMKQMEEEDEELTQEEQMAEKLHRQRLVEESDLLLAVDTFGGGVQEPSGSGLDSMIPKTKEEYSEYSKLLVDKLATVSVEPDDIKKLSSTLNLLHSEKLKAQKGKKSKHKSTKKAALTGASKTGRKDELDYDFALSNEYEDFL